MRYVGPVTGDVAPVTGDAASDGGATIGPILRFGGPVEPERRLLPPEERPLGLLDGGVDRDGRYDGPDSDRPRTAVATRPGLRNRPILSGRLPQRWSFFT